MNNLSTYVKTRLENNIFGEDSIPVYGGAYHLAVDIDNGEMSFSKIVDGIANAIINAKFFTPEIQTTKVAKNFCHLLLIDPALIEAYLGFKF